MKKELPDSAREVVEEERSPDPTDEAAAVFGGEFLAANEIRDARGGELSALAVAEVARDAQARLVGQVASLPEARGLPAVACREGCAWCCSQRSVSAWPLELFAMADWLRKNRSPEELRATMERLREAVAEEDRQRTTSPGRPPRVRCALLQGHRCDIYPVRSASCVGWTSADAAPCQAYAQGDDTAKCEVNHVRMFTARAVPLAAAAALMHRGGPSFDRDGNGPGGFVDLAAGLLVVLERGPVALAEWLAGGTLLEEAARRGHSIPAELAPGVLR